MTKDTLLLSEEDLIKKIHEWFNEGRDKRLGRKVKQAKHGTLHDAMQINGWVKTDLMIALIRKDRNYANTQRTFNPTIYHIAMAEDEKWIG